MGPSPPSPSRPSDAPPAPPPEAIIARGRRRALIIGAAIVAAVGLLLFLARDPIPEARARTGIPLPGLQSEDGDAALAAAPASAFAPLSWELLGRIGGDPEAPIVPADLAALDGRPVVVAGFMVPLEAGATTLDFVVVPDMGRCWFCEAPDPSRSIYCRAAFGPIPAEYDRPVRIAGVLDVEPILSEGVLHSLVRLRAVRVETL